MKKILLLAVCTLMATAAHAQSVAGDAQNESIGKTSSPSESSGQATEIGCPTGQCNKHLWKGARNANTNPPMKSGGSSDTSGSQGQGGVNDKQ